MKLKEREKDGVAILEASGRIMGGEDSELFKSTLNALVHEGKTRVVLDLGAVSHVNSTGLGILISGYTTLKRSDGELKLLRVSDKIQSIFMITRLYSVFETFEDEDEAVQSFARD